MRFDCLLDKGESGEILEVAELEGNEESKGKESGETDRDCSSGKASESLGPW